MAPLTVFSFKFKGQEVIEHPDFTNRAATRRWPAGNRQQIWFLAPEKALDSWCALSVDETAF